MSTPTRAAETDDGWTVLTLDGSRCAQFEHTLVVTGTGAEVLTLPGAASDDTTARLCS